MLTTSVILLVVFGWSHACTGCFSPLNWRVNELRVAEFNEIAGPIVLDVRVHGAHGAGGINGAILLTELTWEEALSEFLLKWEPDRLVVIYCGERSCIAGRRVALRLLADLPTMRVYLLRGGLPAPQTVQESEINPQISKIRGTKL